jgi:hypothetical protein
VTKPQSLVYVSLTQDQALVLFELLAREVEADSTALTLVDDAERIVLWNVEAQLEKRLDALIDPGYGNILERSREAVRNMSIEDMPE